MIEAVVVSFNNGSSLLSCCDALLGVDEIDLVRVVDNSEDGTDVAMLRNARPGNPRIVTVSNGANIGFGAAINQALKKVEQPYIAMVNPDGIVDDGAMKRLLQALVDDPAAVLAGARLLGRDATEQQGSRRREPTPSRLLMNTAVRAFRLRRWYQRGFELSDASLPLQPTAVDAVSGACILARTKALKAINGFDEAFFLHFEDLDLCKRLRDAGGRILFVPEAAFRHAGGGSSASHPYFVIWHKHRSMMKYYWKHYRHLELGGLWIPVIFAVAAVRCLFQMAKRLIRGSKATKDIGRHMDARSD